jgi:hypothetical protein
VLVIMLFAAGTVQIDAQTGVAGRWRAIVLLPDGTSS